MKWCREESTILAFHMKANRPLHLSSWDGTSPLPSASLLMSHTPLCQCFPWYCGARYCTPGCLTSAKQKKDHFCSLLVTFMPPTPRAASYDCWARFNLSSRAPMQSFPADSWSQPVLLHSVTLPQLHHLDFTNFLSYHLSRPSLCLAALSSTASDTSQLAVGKIPCLLNMLVHAHPNIQIIKKDVKQ